MKALIISVLITLSVFFISCKGHKEEAAAAIPAISDSLVKNVQTAPAIVEDASDIIKLNGKIEANENKQAKVFSLVSGRVTALKVELGDYVHKGQVLAVIKSTEVAGYTNDLSNAESNVTMAKKAMETSKDLYDSKLATEQDYLTAKIAYNKALSELNRVKEVSAITGGKSSAYTVTAPLNGFIIEKNITNASEVRADNNTNLFAIADLSNVWVMANVYEADMDNIHLGDMVKVNTLANSEKEYAGKIDKIYNVLDPATRTMKVRISMDNPGTVLKPEMFATVTVNVKGKTSRLSIPAQAIVMDNSKNYVVVKKDNKLEVQEVNLLRRIDNKAYISGLAEGAQVVTNSQVFLYQALITK
ncbi:efflux RND transporter periplasmic adaptor subunit [Ferruginibacter paludis]|uniref:efflux RND transporter periplasmic adaptor subunit n=1 Tax=Ferruginibacter paludis TaxID=1310417 RepID=UPI0025B35B70|nr:efflux RND transporter periplasmic adaptor subunit [Ferruginibacter paludis]MDN3657187.1 efflux RND transporter periplasmic adaptor subunit [Ferruginibacter paludis]